MAFEFLEDFGKKRPSYGVNMARMRNDADTEKKTLFVEGEADKRLFRLLLRDQLKQWNIELGPKKKGVLERFKKYRENPVSTRYAYFSVDLDYDFALNLLLKDHPRKVPLMEADNFFYQLFDIAGNSGYNDFESFLMAGDAYTNYMVSLGYDEEEAESVRNFILNAGVVMGAFRLANLWVCVTEGLGDGISLLCERRKEKAGTSTVKRHGGASGVQNSEDLEPVAQKFGVKFLLEFGLLDLEEMRLPEIEMVSVMLEQFFEREEFGSLLPKLSQKVKEIYGLVRAKKMPWEHLLRGHDLTELLAHKLILDKKKFLPASKAKSGESYNGVDYVSYEMLRDEVETSLRAACLDSKVELKKFPLGQILKPE